MGYPSLPVGDPARPAVRAALAASVLNAVVFTAFAYVTTQVKPVRHASPWQDDPYDTVVTFTMFFVPIVTGLIVLRALLCRRAEPLPVHRAAQLLRASAVSAVLVTATAVTDWAAVVARADHAHWNSRTPGLIAALAVLSATTAGTWALLARTRGLLPRPAGGAAAGNRLDHLDLPDQLDLPDRLDQLDWLDDALPLVRLLGTRLPVAGRSAGWLERHDAAGWVRRRNTAVVAAGSVLAGLLVATGLAREDGFGPLFFSEALWFAGGMYAFGVIADDLLQLTARRPRTRLRRAARLALVAGAAALPASLGLRRALLTAAGLTGTRATPASVTALTVVCALLVGLLSFAVALLPTRRRQPGPAPPAGGVEPG